MSYNEPKVRVLSAPPTVQISVEVYRALKRFFEKSSSERLVYLHGKVDNEKKAVAVLDISIPPQLSAGASVEPDYDHEGWLDWDLAFMAKCRQIPMVGIAHSFSGGGHHSDRDINTDSVLGEEAKDANRTVLVSLTAKAGAWGSGYASEVRCDVVWTPLNVGNFQAAWDDVHWWFYGDEDAVARMLDGSEDRVKAQTYSYSKKEEGDTPLSQAAQENLTKIQKSISVNTTSYKEGNLSYADGATVAVNSFSMPCVDWFVVRDKVSLRIHKVKYYNYDLKRYELIDVQSRNRYVMIGDKRTVLEDDIIWRYMQDLGVICGSDAKGTFHFLGRGHIHTISDRDATIFDKEKAASDFIRTGGMAGESVWDTELQMWKVKPYTPPPSPPVKSSKKMTRAEKKAARRASRNAAKVTLQPILDDMGFTKDDIDAIKAISAYISTEQIDETADTLSDLYRSQSFNFIITSAENAQEGPRVGKMKYTSADSASRVVFDSRTNVTREQPMCMCRWTKVTNLGISMCAGRTADNQVKVYVIISDSGDILEIDEEDFPSASEIIVGNFQASTLKEVFAELEVETTTPASDDIKGAVEEAFSGGGETTKAGVEAAKEQALQEALVDIDSTFRGQESDA